MTRDRTDSSEKEIRDQAADFLARVHAEDASEADWLDLEAWLAASAAHRDAYDRARPFGPSSTTSGWRSPPAWKTMRPLPMSSACRRG